MKGPKPAISIVVVLLVGLLPSLGFSRQSDRERINALEKTLSGLSAQLKLLSSQLTEWSDRIGAFESRTSQAAESARSAIAAAQVAQAAIAATDVRAASAANELRQMEASIVVLQNMVARANATISMLENQGQTKSPAPEKRETGTASLITGASETDGYGLYSYLLFGSKPTGVSRDRYRSAITAWLTAPTAQGLLREHIPPKLLNIFYLPLIKKLDAPGTTSKTPTPDEILDLYDWDRAAALLHTLPGDHLEGPYIVSVLSPLSRGKSALSANYLYQDLSSIPSNAVILWIREFQSRTAQERFWEEDFMSQLALDLRTAVAKLSRDLPALTGIIAWLKGN